MEWAFSVQEKSFDLAKTLPQIKVLGSARLPGSGVRVAGTLDLPLGLTRGL